MGAGSAQTMTDALLACDMTGDLLEQESHLLDFEKGLGLRV